MSEIWIEESDRAALDRRIAADIAERLALAIEERGKATLAVSGGSTPKAFFRLLSAADLQWSRVTVTLVDDRWVPPEHADSNALLVRENLLIGPAKAARFVPLVNARLDPFAAEEEVCQTLAEFDTIDVLILGMGGDGHFASLFPASTSLDAGLDLSGDRPCIAVDPPEAPHQRMSMTLPRIFDTRCLMLHIVGESKREVLEEARKRADPRRLPIAAVLEGKGPAVHIYWAP